MDGPYRDGANGAFCCNIFVFLFGVKILNIVLYMLRHGVYACVCRWGALYLSAWGVTKHGYRCPSPTGVKSVYDGVGIDSREMYAYRYCSLLM